MAIRIKIPRRKYKLLLLIPILLALSIFLKKSKYLSDSEFNSLVNVDQEQVTSVKLKENQYDENVHNAEQNELKVKRRITMHTYVPPAPCENCPGEFGTGVNITVSERFLRNISVFCSLLLILRLKSFKDDEKRIYDILFKKEFFNSIASDKISLWRRLPDHRRDEYTCF
jgi:hypothetical protein